MTASWSTSGVDLHLGLRSDGPRRAALEDALRRSVRDGRVVAGDRLPSTRALATELGLARGTVTAAYDQLVAEGFLVATQGSGTVVADLRRPAAAGPTRTPRPALPLDLTPGSPDVSSFPAAPWLRAARRALAAAPASAMGYDDPRGRTELREALTDYLGRTRGVHAAPDRIVVTTGYVQALALLARVAGSGAVTMEDPGLPFHRDVVRAAGRPVLPLPVDAHGAHAPVPQEADLAVVTPAHQYPTGVPLAPERRHALVDWAGERGGWVVEDDYDGEFRYDRQPVGALQAMAPEQVVYVGSAAKTLAPGVRLGWMVLPAALVEPVVEAKRYVDLQTETLGQLTLADLVRTHGYDRHVRAMRLRYRRRRDRLREVLERRAGRHARGVSPASIAAGLQTVVTVADEAGLVEQARRQGLALAGLSEHFHETEGATQGLVIGFGRPSDASYPRALAALAGILP